MKKFPAIIDNKPDTLKQTLEFISRERNATDVPAWNNLSNVFMRGRKVGKTPASSTDTAATDQYGDFNYDASYLYLAVNNSGSLAWRRIALATW